jgi:hypothetical protein
MMVIRKLKLLSFFAIDSHFSICMGLSPSVRSTSLPVQDRLVRRYLLKVSAPTIRASTARHDVKLVKDIKKMTNNLPTHQMLGGPLALLGCLRLAERWE